MNGRFLLALPALALAGCASPLDDPRHRATANDMRAGGLPAWVLDEWRTADAAPARSANSVNSSDDALGSGGLDEMIAWALAHNPGVQAAEARWRGSAERIAQARSLPDPQLSYRMLIEQIDTAGDPVGHVLGLSQMFPWFGALEAAEGVAEAEARAAGRGYVAAQLSAAAAVKEAYAEHAYVLAGEAILGEHVEILRQFEAVARAMLRTAQAAQRDLVRAQVELERVDNDLRDLRDVRSATAARLNAALGRRADAPLPERFEVPSVEARVDEAGLLALLERSSPELAGLRDRIEARRRGVGLAESRFGPDFMLGVEYGVNTSARMARMDGGGEDMLGLMVSVGLPIRRTSYEAGRRGALAEWGEAVRMFTDRRNTLESELKMTLFALREAERRRVLYGQSLRVRAQQVLATTTTAYRAGEASFTDLIQAQRELLEFELAHARAVSDRFQRLAQVEAIVGEAARGTDNPDTGAQR